MKKPVSDFIGIPLEEMPNTKRPMGVSDLKSYQLSDDTILHLRGRMASDPVLLEFWMAVVKAAAENPKLRVDGTEIKRPLEPADIEEAIRESQETYDKNRKSYWEVANGADLSDHSLYGITDYARLEKLEMVK